MMTKLLIGLLGAAVVATGGYAAATGIDADPARTVSLPGATDGDATGETTTVASTTNEADDISGPCDEAEHRNDPRCAGSPAPATASAATGATTTNEAEDVPGPCDEAEHRNDPRCAGALDADDRGDDHDDDSGRGGDDDHDREGHGGDDDEDRSGSNSGRG